LCGAGLLAMGASAWAADELDVRGIANVHGVSKTLNADGSDTFNTVWLGHNDMQGRVIYQTTPHTMPNQKMLVISGSFAGTMLNPQTGNVEQNGAGIVDATDPTNPVYLKHLPANNGGSRMIKMCDGNVLPKGVKNHVYLLRENGASSHEVWDITSPASPTLVSTPVTGVDTTHRNWWDCQTGIGYLVAGATKTTDPSADGWNPGAGQHLKIYDLSNPATPKYIMDFGYPGQQPGSTLLMPGTTIVQSQVHGPIVAQTVKGKTYNKLYMPYGVGSDGLIQIINLAAMLPAPYGTGKYANIAKPTDAELLQGTIGTVYMPGAEGGHSSYPIYGIPLSQYQNFTNNTTRDIMAVTSEETDNRCTGSPHLSYLLDITSTIGAGGHTSAEQHPWPISTLTVDDFSGRPNYCSRGTRFGVHSTDENFNSPYYGRLLTEAWFDAGIRVFDIRDPYHPAEVAHFVAPVNSFTQASGSTINGITYSQLDVSCDNTDVDDQGAIYCGDRVGGGLDIVGLTGTAAAIAEQ
jgi:hypothetical protein